MATDPDTPGRELRLRAEAISPTLAEHARRKLQDRIGLSHVDNPDGAGHLTATLTPETVALRNAVLHAAAPSHRIDGDTRAAPPRSRHEALHDPLRHAADSTEPASPSKSSNRTQLTTGATAATRRGKHGATPTRTVGSTHRLPTRGTFLRILCHTAYLNTPPARLEISRLSRLSRTVTAAQWRAF